MEHQNIELSSFWGSSFLESFSTILPGIGEKLRGKEDYFYEKFPLGDFRGALLPAGISMVSMSLKKSHGGMDFSFDSKNNQVPYKIGFCLEGPIYLNYPSFEGKLRMDGGQSFITKLQPKSRMSIPYRQPVSLLFLFLSKQSLSSYLEQSKESNSLSKDLLSGQKSFCQTKTNLAVEQCLTEIQSFENRDGMDRISLQAKVLHLLSLFFSPYQKRDNRSAEYEKVVEIHKYLNGHFAEKLTVKSIAVQYGWNPQKLQKAFKDIYGNTLMAQLRKIRMDKAYHLIERDGLLVKEAAFAVGYSNISHFIEAFQREFSISPGNFRRNIL